MSDTPKPGIDWLNDPDLSEKWKFRFDFYERYGCPDWGSPTKEFKAAWKALPLGGRLKVNFNFWAFFFGIFYFLVLGLWRQAIVGLLVILGIISVEIMLDVSDTVSRALSMGVWFVFAVRVNGWYYHKKVKGTAGWMF